MKANAINTIPTTIEVWAEAEGFGGLLEVSTKGNFRTTEREVSNQHGSYTVKAKAKTPTRNPITGYFDVRIRIDGILYREYAHRIVMNAFAPTTDATLQINHKNFNKGNNTLNNLEWITASDNMKHLWNTEGGRKLTFTEEKMDEMEASMATLPKTKTGKLTTESADILVSTFNLTGKKQLDSIKSKIRKRNLI